MTDLESVLARRHDNGADYWATPDGRLGVGAPFSTLESLLILHELGVPATHEAVEGALELVLDAWREDGRFRTAPRGAIYPCHTAWAARVLCRFGFADDPRLQATFEHFLETRHEDGGWRCNRSAPDRPETRRSNPGVALNVLDAFRLAERASDRAALDRAVETLLDHWDRRVPTGPCGFGIGSLFMQIEYPFFRYNLFSYTYVLSSYDRARGDARFRAALEILESKLDEEGRIVVERPNRKLASFSLCAKGLPSEPATGRYREILGNLDAGGRRG